MPLVRFKEPRLDHFASFCAAPAAGRVVHAVAEVQQQHMKLAERSEARIGLVHHERPASGVQICVCMHVGLDEPPLRLVECPPPLSISLRQSESSQSGKRQRILHCQAGR